MAKKKDSLKINQLQHVMTLWQWRPPTSSASILTTCSRNQVVAHSGGIYGPEKLLYEADKT